VLIKRCDRTVRVLNNTKAPTGQTSRFKS
jgi:hypothetical protein